MSKTYDLYINFLLSLRQNWTRHENRLGMIDFCRNVIKLRKWTKSNEDPPNQQYRHLPCLYNSTKFANVVQQNPENGKHFQEARSASPENLSSLAGNSAAVIAPVSIDNDRTNTCDMIQARPRMRNEDTNIRIDQASRNTIKSTRRSKTRTTIRRYPPAKTSAS